MKTLRDPGQLLAEGLADIRRDLAVPEGFPPEVVAEAEAAAKRVPSDHADWTHRPFVTLDPETSRDLDQAFAIEAAGGDLLLHYAIADVGFFVDEGSAMDAEAWRRGTTLYLPDGKAGLYPPVLSEAAASLLPGGPRPAITFTVRVDAAGDVALDGVTRAVIESRAKLAYGQARTDQLPREFDELSRRIAAAELARGAARADPPQQEVATCDDGSYQLRFRPREAQEDDNAAMSLACNLAVAQLLAAHRTGLFRVMPEPYDSAVRRLRHSAKALGIDWPKAMSLIDLERRLDPNRLPHAALLLEIRRASPGASYAPFDPRLKPWHAAMAASYAHATAPLRRLADRYVCLAALALANGKPVPDNATAAFARLPKAMARADARAGQVERAVIDLAEAVALKPRVGESFEAVVTDVDERGARVQLCGLPVVTRIGAPGAEPGDCLSLKLTAADLSARTIDFVVEEAPADAAV